ncbi:MAG: phosphopantothenoylcysteine decarboxylase [Planctomycetota bacterium]
MVLPDSDPGENRSPISLLLTAGPTREPIDSVRFLGNRSSGRLGVAVADAAAKRGWSVTVLLGPTEVRPNDERVDVVPFESTAELDSLLTTHLPKNDVLIMAAAVSDYRPVVTADDLLGKHRRGDGLKLQLEPTPDLLAGCSRRRTPGQLLVGFALEPSERLESSALSKLDRKGIDLIVANPLETMGADTIDARLFASSALQAEGVPPEQRAGTKTKATFADWLLDRTSAALSSRRTLDSARAN